MRKSSCTEEKKCTPKKYSDYKREKKTQITEFTEERIFDALIEQQNTLQNIESILQRIERCVSPDYVLETVRKMNEQYRRENGASAFGM